MTAKWHLPGCVVAGNQRNRSWELLEMVYTDGAQPLRYVNIRVANQLFSKNITIDALFVTCDVKCHR